MQLFCSVAFNELTLMDATPVSLLITYPFTSIYFMTYLANINPLHHY